MGSIVFCRAVLLASSVDTVRATQMQVNTEFRSLFVPEMTHTRETVKMHVSASILVNKVAYGLGEGKQLIKKMDSIGSQQFNVPKAFCVMNVNQTTKHTEKSLL